MANERSFARLGANRIDLEIALQDRLDDADALFLARRYASSISMGLYALEICLKVAICQRLNLEALPTAFEVHHFQGLLVLSGLKKPMQDPAAAHVLANWDSVTSNGPQHVNDLRYLPSYRWVESDARELLDRLQSPSDGVLTWITAQL